MTALNPEPIKQENQAQEKPEQALSQPKQEDNNIQEKIESTQQEKVEENVDPDWRAFREARKKDRAERIAAEQRAQQKEQEIAALKAAMEAAFSTKSAPSPEAYQQYYGMGYQDNETEEQKIERKVNELLEKKEQQYRREQAEQELREYPNKLKRDFPDFAHICSQENLDYLDYHYPEISRPLQRLQEGYEKWSDIYHAVKKLIPNHANVKKEAIRAEINSNKPKSISSTLSSPTGDKPMNSYQEIENRRAENWARMQRTLKGV